MRNQENKVLRSDTRRSSLLTPIAIVTCAWLAKKAFGATKARVTQPAAIAAGVVTTGRKARGLVQKRNERQKMAALENLIASKADFVDQRVQDSISQDSTTHDSTATQADVLPKGSDLSNLLTALAVSVTQVVIEKILENRQNQKPEEA